MKTMRFPINEVNKIDCRAVKDFNECLFAINRMAFIAELLGAGKNKIELDENHELLIKCEDCTAFKPRSDEYEFSVVWDNGNMFSYRVNHRVPLFNTTYMTFEMIDSNKARTVEHIDGESVVTFFDYPRDMAEFIVGKMLED